MAHSNVSYLAVVCLFYVCLQQTCAIVVPGRYLAQADPNSTWAVLSSTMSSTLDVNSSNPCSAGLPECYQALVAEMYRRLPAEVEACAHRAPFALLYLRVSEGLEKACNTPGFFEDPRFVRHYSCQFAKKFFYAQDNYDAGKYNKVTAAWRIALDAAKAKQVTLFGDLLLGVTAHLRRDLTYAIYEILQGLPDYGAFRKTDHTKVNLALGNAATGFFQEVFCRFDVAPAQIPSLPLPAWREGAWQDAQKLLRARPDKFGCIASKIDKRFEEWNTLVLQATSYGAPGNDANTTARDAYCAVNHLKPACGPLTQS